MKFYRCERCGNLVTQLVEGAGTLVCCGQPMGQLEAGVTDGAAEKHLPSIRLEGKNLTVQVGDVLHPMTPEHFIQFVLVRQGDQMQYRKLAPTDEPKADFIVDGDHPFTVYAFCNLHGLWMTEHKG